MAQEIPIEPLRALSRFRLGAAHFCTDHLRARRVEIYSATLHTKFEGMQIKQVYWIVAGVVLMFLVSLINYQALLELVPWMYGFSLLSLVSVLLFGKRYLGAKRWIDLKLFHFQPSEWVKLILILTMAKYFAEYRENDLPFRELVKAGMIVLFPMLLVLKQPDLGTALTYIPIAIMALVLGGMRPKHGIVLLRDCGRADAGRVEVGAEALPEGAAFHLCGA